MLFETCELRMKTPALLPPPFASSSNVVDQVPVMNLPEDHASAERALRQLASLMKSDDARCRSVLELAATLKPVSHWGLNE